jgi:hypothetical protein
VFLLRDSYTNPSFFVTTTNKVGQTEQSFPIPQVQSPKFVFLDSDDAAARENACHPPCFAAIFRRTRGKKVLECHSFVCKTEQAALALVQSCTHAYQNPQDVDAPIPLTPLFYKFQREESANGVEKNISIVAAPPQLSLHSPLAVSQGSLHALELDKIEIVDTPSEAGEKASPKADSGYSENNNNSVTKWETGNDEGVSVSEARDHAQGYFYGTNDTKLEKWKLWDQSKVASERTRVAPTSANHLIASPATDSPPQRIVTRARPLPPPAPRRAVRVVRRVHSPSGRVYEYEEPPRDYLPAGSPRDQHQSFYVDNASEANAPLRLQRNMSRSLTNLVDDGRSEVSYAATLAPSYRIPPGREGARSVTLLRRQPPGHHMSTHSLAYAPSVGNLSLYRGPPPPARLVPGAPPGAVLVRRVGFPTPAESVVSFATSTGKKTPKLKKAKKEKPKVGSRIRPVMVV